MNDPHGVVHVGGDGHHPAHAGRTGPMQHRLPVFPEGGACQMTVAVEEIDHAVAGSALGFRSRSFPSPQRFWISMSAGEATKMDE